MLTLLNLLKDGRFHSGQALGAALGISRSAVWKQLQHLEAELGLSINKVRGRGYQLAAPLTLLDPLSIGALTPVWPMTVFDSIDSTNDLPQLPKHRPSVPFVRDPLALPLSHKLGIKRNHLSFRRVICP